MSRDAKDSLTLLHCAMPFRFSIGTRLIGASRSSRARPRTSRETAPIFSDRSFAREHFRQGDLLFAVALAAQRRSLLAYEQDMDNRGTHALVSARAILTLAANGDDGAQPTTENLVA